MNVLSSESRAVRRRAFFVGIDSLPEKNMLDVWTELADQKDDSQKRRSGGNKEPEMRKEMAGRTEKVSAIAALFAKIIRSNLRPVPS